MPDTIPLPNRRLLTLEGPDTLPLLERLVTHNTQNWDPGETRYGALLTPQGKVIADFLALRTESGVALDVNADIAEDLLKRLTLFRLRSKVDLSVADGVHIAACPPDGALPDGAVHAFEDIRFADHRKRVVLPGACPDSELSAYHYDRIAHGVPEQGEDFETADVFPADINMDRHGGVDLKKGCFVGQEVVSRMHRRGKVRKRTVMLRGAGLERGQDIAAASVLGEVTSVAGDIALARLRIDRLARSLKDGSPVHAGSEPVELALPDWLRMEIEALETA